MMDFTHVDASEWPRVVCDGPDGKRRIAIFAKGRDYIETSSGIVLTTHGIHVLAHLTKDDELHTMYERRDRIRRRVFEPEFVMPDALLHPKRVALVAKMKVMHERGEG